MKQSDWKLWGTFERFSVIDGVFLSLGLAPTTNKPPEHLHEIQRRLDMVSKAIKGRALYAKGAGYGDIQPEKREVDREAFASWAKEIDWQVPDEFAQWATPQDDNRQRHANDLGDNRQHRAHESDDLRKLIQASQRFFANADRSDPSSIPKNRDIEAWLIDNGLGRTNAEAAARIIRPGWANKKGGKPKSE